MTIRSPIVSVLGHVDHGKTSILDKIRTSSVVKGEAGAITQAIGASMIPTSAIIKNSGELLRLTKTELTIPGLLFIDTPGHAAFSSMRSRGGNLADIAILVVDINEGFKPQTIEAIEILKSFKTPFVIAANKIDRLSGYQKSEALLIQDINSQTENVKERLNMKLYELVGQLHEQFQMEAERFDRIEDYKKKVAIIPCSAIENIGISELLMIVSGLAQKFLEDTLNIDVSGVGKGTVLEVKKEEGLGMTINSILYDGKLSVNDKIIFGGVNSSINTKIRALLIPEEHQEIRDKKTRFKSVKSIDAAASVRIVCPSENEILSGVPFETCEEKDISIVSEMIQKQISDVFIDTESEGIIVKADSVGGLEALVKLLKDKSIKIRKASVGDITKKDIIDAEASKDFFNKIILGFNVKPEKDSKVKIIVSDIIYKLLEKYDYWIEEIKKNLETKQIDTLVRPVKLEVLQNCIFRQSNPCIVGVEVLSGSLKTGYPLMKKERKLSIVKSINIQNKPVKIAEKGKQVAIALDGVIAGRHVFEGDILFSAIPEKDFRSLKKLKGYLSKDEIEVLKEFVQHHRSINPVWGI